MKKRWLDAFKAIQNPSIGSVTIGSNIYGYRYIIHDEASRIGYMIIWDKNTKEAVRLSRVGVPIDAIISDSSDILLGLSDIPLDLKYVG